METWQKDILRYVATAFKENTIRYVTDEVQQYFKGHTPAISYEERTGIYYITFSSGDYDPHLVIGLGDTYPNEWNGTVVFGVYANAGHELGIYGETQFLAPEIVVKNILAEIHRQLTARPCPNHEGAYDCTPFCVKCAGDQII